MGHLLNGEWQTDAVGGTDKKGAFVRADAGFRSWITPDGAPGPSGDGGFAAESGRYHLYVANACPWAHRTVIFRGIKGLEDHIGLSIVDPMMLDKGWAFSDEPGTIPDTLNGAQFAYELYQKARPTYSGRVTVPILWDKATNTIVSNESSEIIRMFNSAFNAITNNTEDYYPAELRGEIDALNNVIYGTVNNGVYKCGFAASQEAYEAAFDALFETLDMLDDRLATRRTLMGNMLTEADWRLFTTLVRFDPVYVGHFKCNRQRIADYPHLSGYLRDLYQRPGIAGTVNMDHIKRHYYGSHETVNPRRIVPLGPTISYDAPANREHLGAVDVKKAI
ncbi:MAG: glutathione S-transferase family protein [Pseudomonadota bacterium]